MLRIPGGPIEDRTVDGSCNPYLAMAAILAAGLDGIENEIDPGDPHNDATCTRPARGAASDGDRAAAGQPAGRDPRAAKGRGRCARRWAHAGTEDYIDYYVKTASGASGAPTTSRSRRGRSSATSRSSERRCDDMCGIAGLFARSERDRGRAGRAPERDAGAARTTAGRTAAGVALLSRPGAGRVVAS